MLRHLLHAWHGRPLSTALRTPFLLPRPATPFTSPAPPTPKEIVHFLDHHIVGQTEAKRIVATGIYNHYCRQLRKLASPDAAFLDKSNIMLVGPSGTGKTLLSSTAARLLKVPFATGDATELTEAGYVGEDVDLLLYRLLEKAEFNVPLAQRGIVFLDEVDKLARTSLSPSLGGKDVGGQGVQQALLKMIEGTVVDVRDRRRGERGPIAFDTSSLLFIFSGAFNGLDGIVRERVARVPLSFGHAHSATAPEKGEWGGAPLSTDLMAYGLIPEFIGRIPVIAVLRELDQEAFERILTEPENALVRQYQQLFALNQTRLTFSPKAISQVAAMAVDLKVGARGLRSILERILVPWMYEVPRSDIAELHFEEVRDGTPPAMVRREPL